MPKTLKEIQENNSQTGRGYDEQKRPRPFTATEFLEISSEMGATQENPQYRALHENLARWIVERFHPVSSLEIGSGPGYLLFCLNEFGVDAIGVDGNEESKTFFCLKHPKWKEKYRLDPLFEAGYGHVDVVLSIEVFEHIDDDGLVKIMEKIQHELSPRVIIFSSTPYPDAHPDWDRQWGHINIKMPHEWDKFFEKFGYVLQHGVTPPVTEWAKVYVPAPKHIFKSYQIRLR